MRILPVFAAIAIGVPSIAAAQPAGEAGNREIEEPRRPNARRQGPARRNVLERVNRMFDRLDTNSDGVIDRGEFSEEMPALVRQMRERRGGRRGAARRGQGSREFGPGGRGPSRGRGFRGPRRGFDGDRGPEDFQRRGRFRDGFSPDRPRRQGPPRGKPRDQFKDSDDFDNWDLDASRPRNWAQRGFGRGYWRRGGGDGPPWMRRGQRSGSSYDSSRPQWRQRRDNWGW